MMIEQSDWNLKRACITKLVMIDKNHSIIGMKINKISYV
jgi:hypothetical protein